jgi:hypothetical protein
MKRLGLRMNTSTSGYVIPRRCGKTSFSCALIALMSVFAPAAGLKILYTAQREDLCKNAFETVLRNLPFLVKEFNTTQLNRHLTEEARARKNKQVYEKPFMCALTRVEQNAKRVSVLFFLRSSSNSSSNSNINSSCKTTVTDEKIGENDFVSRVYVAANTHRGNTYNLMFVDETNYISAKIFPELIPNLLMEAKMICTTSQKASNENVSKTSVDLRKICMDGVTMCVIEYVCRNHCVALIVQENLAFSACICHIFGQPLHLNVFSSMRRLLLAFFVNPSSSSSSSTSALCTENSYGNSKAAILSEIGIMPPGLDEEALNHLDGGVNIKMVSDEGRKHFLHQRFDLAQLVRDTFGTRKKNHSVPFRKVLTYLDPTPSSYRTGRREKQLGRREKYTTTHDSSKHAMVTITAVQEGKKTRYIVLGVEEFSTEEYEPTTHHAGLAMAVVYMAHILILHRYYHGYFTDYYLIPEINSFDLDNMWYNCEKLLWKYRATFSGVNIYAPCMVYREGKNHHKRNQNQNGKQQISSFRKRKAVIEKVSFEGLLHTQVKRQRMGIDYDQDEGIDFHQIDTALARDSRALAHSIEELKSKMSERHAFDGETHKFKLGFRLGHDKLERFLGFFNNVFNRYNEAADITMALDAVSASLKASYNLAEYVVGKLDSVHLRTEVKPNGVKIHHVSGKKGHHGKHETDDVAVCTVMAQSLYTYYTQLQPEEDDIEQLLRLEPRREGEDEEQEKEEEEGKEKDFFVKKV